MLKLGMISNNSDKKFNYIIEQFRCSYNKTKTALLKSGFYESNRYTYEEALSFVNDNKTIPKQFISNVFLDSNIDYSNINRIVSLLYKNRMRFVSFNFPVFNNFKRFLYSKINDDLNDLFNDEYNEDYLMGKHSNNTLKAIESLEKINKKTFNKKHNKIIEEEIKSLEIIETMYSLAYNLSSQVKIRYDKHYEKTIKAVEICKKEKVFSEYEKYYNQKQKELSSVTDRFNFITDLSLNKNMN